MNNPTLPIDPAWTPAGLADLSRTLYASQRWRWRVLQALRPHICPFGDLLALVPPGSRVLDVGCGSGLFLLMLASFERIESGRGFDLAAEAIDTARAAAATLDRPERLGFAVRSIAEGIPSGDWTVVSVIDVIHHVSPAHQQAFVRSLCAATPPGTRLIIKDMVTRPLWRALGNRLHDLLMARQWVHHVSPDTVDGWVAGEGLRRVHAGGAQMFWYGHWVRVFERPAAP